ncbi:MAG: DNA cytosine methyltransferase [Thermoguttaceae bacterium]
MRFASFFAGIGGFDLGFQRAGMIPAFHCEIDPFCQRILKRHWPEVPLHDDITTLKPRDIPEAELWAGGWPCQDVSHGNAQRKGIHGARSGLFFSFAELARKVRPGWIVMENVSGLLSSDDGAAFESVTEQLEEIGYMGVWFTCNTLSAGLPHNRERIFLVGSYRSALSHQFCSDGGKLFGDNSPRKESRTGDRSSVRGEFISDAPLLVQRRGGFGYTKATSYCPTIRAQSGKHQGGHSDRPILCGQKLDLGRVREANGIPGRLDGKRGRLIGNAVAPPIAQFIGSRIMAIQRGAAKAAKAAS